MPEPLQLVAQGRDGLRVRTAFHFEAGRYRHSIDLVRSSDGVLLDAWDATSLSDDDDWPASPPIQQLSLEMIGGTPALLGVGQAGKSHWSLSVEPVNVDDMRPALKFDLACRCPVQPRWLGSSYTRQVVEGGLAPRDGLDMASTVASSQPRLKLMPGSDSSGTVAEGLVARCDHSAVKTKKFPATFRWTYLVTVS
ncbi:MAG: hypothetical protein ACO1RT_14985 [Planctomycetaceae bacterium]